MSILIDRLIEQSTGVKNSFNNYWYVAKPYGSSGYEAIKERIIDAWRVLTDRSRAYHYKEDEENLA